jgi:hypothetical protein
MTYSFTGTETHVLNIQYSWIIKMSTINKKHKEYFLYKEGVYVIVVLSECSINIINKNLLIHFFFYSGSMSLCVDTRSATEKVMGER